MDYKQERYKIGDLVTFIEGETWVFIDSDGKELKNPPVGIVIDPSPHETGVQVYWTATGSMTTEWLSQVQKYEDFILARKKRERDGHW